MANKGVSDHKEAEKSDSSPSNDISSVGTETPPKWRNFVLISVGVAACYIVLGIVIYYWGFRLGDETQWALRGQFGDMFGVVNALFTGLAFAGLIYTIYLQRTDLNVQMKELKDQRKELEMNREQLARSAGAQELSQEALTKQVRMLERSAQLTAISTLAAAYGREMSAANEAHRRYQDELSSLPYRLRTAQERRGAGVYGADGEARELEEREGILRDFLLEIDIEKSRIKAKYDPLLEELEAVVNEASDR